MKMMRTFSFGLAIIVLLSACTAGRSAFNDGQYQIRRGKYAEGLVALEKAQKADTGNLEYRSYYVRQKELYIRQLLHKADAERIAKKYTEADSTYQVVLQQDP